MPSIINPSQNLLYIAGNLNVEDFITVYKGLTVNDTLTVSGDSILTDVYSDNITNSEIIQTEQLIVTALTRLENATFINGNLTVNGVNTNSIGTSANVIEFYYGDQMQVNDLVVLNSANIPDLTVDIFTANSITAKNELISEGTTELQETTVNTTLQVDGNVSFSAAFEMLDAEYKKDFFDDPVGFTIFVKKDGDDARGGRSEAGAVATIRRGLEIARELRLETESTILVSVGPGIYVEDGGLEIPERCAMISKAGQYVTEIHASDLCRREFRNMILLNSGSYCQGFTFRGQVVDDFDDPSGGFAYAFAPGAYILRSPYVRDSSQVSNEPYQEIAPPLDPATGNPLVGRGGGMMLADRAVINQNSVYPGTLCFGATPRSPNGLGYVAKNGAFVNGISSLTIYQRCSFYALNGGQLTLNNSGTQFGDISLRATGNIDVVVPAEVSSTDILLANIEVADAIVANADVIVDAVWDDLVANGPDRFGNANGSPDYIPWQSTSTFDQAKCARDLTFIINAVKRDLILGTDYNTVTAGMAYQRADSAYVLTDQLTETIDAINQARDEILALSGISSAGTITSLFATITSYISLTPPAYPAISYPGTPGSTYQDADKATASAAIQSNRATIISALTSWIGTNFPSLSYDSVKCERDTGYILDALSHDVRYGGNTASVACARAYFVGAVSQLGPTESAPTAAAYEELKNIINTYVLTVPEQTYIASMLDIVIEVISDGNLNNIDAELEIEIGGLAADEFNWIGSNTAKVISDTLVYINNVLGIYSPYDVAKCSRDVGLIIDSVAQDLVMRTNYNTLTAGMAYHRGVSGSQYVLSNQFNNTLAAIDYVEKEIMELPITQETKDTVRALFENVYFGIRSGDLKHEMIYDTPGLYPYDQDKCFRDVGFIIDAVMLDILLETNYNSRTAGEAYQRASSGYPANGQTDQTVYAINFAKNYIANLSLDPISVTNIENLFQEITDIIETGNASPFYFTETYSELGATGDHKDAADYLQANVTVLQDGTINFLTANYPKVDYDETKCRRDVGYLVDALTHDVLYGGTFAMVNAAQAYFVDTDTTINPGEETLIGEGESEATIAAFENLKTLVNGVVPSVDQQLRISLLLDIVINALGQGSSAYIPEPIEPGSTIGAPTTTDYTTVLARKGLIQRATVEYVNSDLPADLGWLPTTNADDARDLILANKDLIIDDTITYAKATYPTQMADNEEVCRRDAGFIIDGIIHDVTYGGNFATLRLADAYYEDGNIVIPVSEKPATVATWNYMSGIMESVVQGTYPGQQVYPYNTGTTDEANVVSDLMSIVVDYIDNPIANPRPNEELPSTSWVEANTLADYNTIISAISPIQLDTINYTNSLFDNYYESKCKKDEHGLLKAISLDMRGGTQMVTKAFAQGYFKYNGTLAIPAEQLVAFNYVWDSVKVLLQAEAGGALTDEGVMLGELIDALKSTVNDPVKIQFGSLVESLAHQFNNAGAGVNQNALPLNFRRPGYNRPVPFSVLQEGGGRVRWSGADEINNQYFAGGTRINGQTGKFEGRPFNISVRAIARRLANSRGGF